jgi:hypothetical protein
MANWFLAEIQRQFNKERISFLQMLFGTTGYPFVYKK